MTARPRAVVLRALGLGDLLAGVPALRALRAALPEHELRLAAPEVLRPLVALAGTVDELVPTEELAPVPWSGPPPDVAVDLHGNGPASKAVLQALAPRRTVAFAGPDAEGRDLPGPTWEAEEHERARWCRLVTTAYDVPADPEDVLLARPDAPPPASGAVVVHPGAAFPSRRWAPDRFAAVAAALRAEGHDVVVTGSPGERALAERVAAAAGLAPDRVLAGRTDLAALAALVADARLVVAGDTGVAHLASAYRTPSVLLFGPTPPWRWGPPARGPHTVLWRGTGVGDPHGRTVDPALDQLQVPEVIEAARLRLRDAPRPGRCG